jgi:hypothetical protein
LMIAAASIMSFVSVATVAAQWTYRNPSVPRTKDGKPDLKARVPRTAWGTVDLSGVWQTDIKYNANLAADLKPGDVVMLPAGRALFDERQGNLGKDDPEGYCLAPGVPRVNGVPFPQKIVQTPTLVGDPLRNANDVSTDLSRCTALAVERRATYLDGLLKGTLGGRHSRRRDDGFQRKDMAGRCRASTVRARQAD